MNINNNNIHLYINYLYELRTGASAPNEVIASWLGMNNQELYTNLESLYNSWGLSAIEKRKLENDFLIPANAPNKPFSPQPIPEIAQQTPINPNYQQPNPYVQQPVVKEPNKFLKSLKSLLIVGIVLSLGYSGFQYMGIQNLKKTEVDSTATKATDLLPTKKVEPTPIEATTALVDPNVEIQKTLIQEFLKGEINRNINQVYNCLSPDIELFYSIRYPTYEEIRNTYQTMWQKKQNEEYQNVIINPSGKNTYIVNSLYNFLSLNSDSLESVKKQTKFTLDNNNKIIKVEELN